MSQRRIDCQHDTRAAIEFLRKFHPSGIWALTSIVPDGKTTTMSFSPDQWAAASTWIEDRQGVENIYFHVNPVMRKIANKASKGDIARIAWLHVDIDPRPGVEAEDARAGALDALEAEAGGVPAPTCIIDSGGGVQAFWRLRNSQKLVIDGNIDRATDLEQYNVQLERIFGGDSCHNVDRIMRLPGTINIPNRKKLAKGRVPRMASVVRFSDTEYPIDQFIPAVKVQTDGMSRPAVKLMNGNIPDVDVDRLKEWCSETGKRINDRILAVIATGEDPYEPNRYPSRSEAVFAVCCELVRAHVPDEMVFGAITSPGNAISVSVREKKNFETYALRQIERAHELAIDPMLAEFNDKHAVIADLGGRCRIISEVFDEALKRYRVSKQSFEDFRNRYRNRYVEVGKNKGGDPVYKTAGVWWVDHPKRKQYETIVFAPGREVKDAYNLWKGFAVGAVPGSNHIGYLNHIRENICHGNDVYYNYLIGWMARAVQHPDTQGEVAVVLRGARGTGKGFFAKTFGRLFGRHFIQVADSKHLVGNFNAHLRDAVLLFGDEAFFAGDKRHESVLKVLITEETIVIEGKGIDAESAANFTHVILSSNEAWVVPAGVDERRFFVLDVADTQKTNTKYFQQLTDELYGQNGIEHLLHFLMTYDISEYEVRNPPSTKALLDQKVLSLSQEHQWFLDKLRDGKLIRSDDAWRCTVSKDMLYNDYIEDMRAQNVQRRLSRTGFNRFIHGVAPDVTLKQAKCDVQIRTYRGTLETDTRRCYAYIFPQLHTCRAFWDKNLGGPFDWPDQENQLEEESLF